MQEKTINCLCQNNNVNIADCNTNTFFLYIFYSVCSNFASYEIKFKLSSVDKADDKRLWKNVQLQFRPGQEPKVYLSGNDEFGLLPFISPRTAEISLVTSKYSRPAFVWETYRQMTITDAIHKVCKECFILFFFILSKKYYYRTYCRKVSFSFPLSFFFQSFLYSQIFQLKRASSIWFYVVRGVAGVFRLANKIFDSFKRLLSACKNNFDLFYMVLVNTPCFCLYFVISSISSCHLKQKAMLCIPLGFIIRH